jgi:hypothetical protein
MPFWSPDGDFLYFLRTDQKSRALWRIPASGAMAVEIAQLSAVMAKPALDGRNLIVERDGSLWKVALNTGGPGELILREVGPRELDCGSRRRLLPAVSSSRASESRVPQPPVERKQTYNSAWKLAEGVRSARVRGLTGR